MFETPLIGSLRLWVKREILLLTRDMSDRNMGTKSVEVSNRVWGCSTKFGIKLGKNWAKIFIFMHTRSTLTPKILRVIYALRSTCSQFYLLSCTRYYYILRHFFYSISRVTLASQIPEPIHTRWSWNFISKGFGALRRRWRVFYGPKTNQSMRNQWCNQT